MTGAAPRTGVGNTGGAGALGAVLARPRLWATALRQAARLAAPGWWHRPPFVPRPERRYLAFRVETHSGDGTRPFAPADLVTYLEWCRAEDRRVRTARRRRR